MSRTARTSTDTGYTGGSIRVESVNQPNATIEELKEVVPTLTRGNPDEVLLSMANQLIDKYNREGVNERTYFPFSSGEMDRLGRYPDVYARVVEVLNAYNAMKASKDARQSIALAQTPRNLDAFYEDRIETILNSDPKMVASVVSFNDALVNTRPEMSTDVRYEVLPIQAVLPSTSAVIREVTSQNVDRFTAQAEKVVQTRSNETQMTKAKKNQLLTFGGIAVAVVGAYFLFFKKK